MNAMPFHALVTGAGGFIGGHLVGHLRDAGWIVDAVRARPGTDKPATQASGDDALRACKGDPVIPGRAMQAASNRVVFHVGGIPGALGKTPSVLLRANRDLPVELYEAAAGQGARAFVFVSSAKVLGEASAHPLATDAPPRPRDLYARSKAEAEALLVDAHARIGLPLAIVRSPLVYGPGVGGSFLTLLRWIEAGRPLPFGAARAPRSFVSVVNLAHALRLIGEQANDGCNVHHVTDGDDVSMREMCLRLAAGLGVRARLIPLPRSWFALAARIIGRAGMVDVFDACRLDDRALRNTLGWAPPQTMDQAIEGTTRWFRTL